MRLNCVKHCWEGVFQVLTRWRTKPGCWLPSPESIPEKLQKQEDAQTESTSNIKTEKILGKPKAAMNRQGQVQPDAMGEQAEGELLNSALVFTLCCHERWQKPAAVACSCGPISGSPSPGGRGWSIPMRLFDPWDIYSPRPLPFKLRTRRPETKETGRSGKCKTRESLKALQKELIVIKGIKIWRKTCLSIEKWDAKI